MALEKKMEMEVGEMAHWVKALSAKANNLDLISISRSHRACLHRTRHTGLEVFLTHTRKYIYYIVNKILGGNMN